jgi:3-oxoacyl-[acyl-carrier-protein] synthase III
MKRTNVGLAGLPGIFLPPSGFKTAELITELGIRYPDTHEDVEKRGKPLPLDWAERYFGIKELPRDYRWVDGRLIKPSREEGGLYGVDLGIWATDIALQNAGLAIEQIGRGFEYGATADTVGMSTHQRYFYEELGLPKNVPFRTIDVGCAGFFDALMDAEDCLRSGRSKYVLAIFQNCPSAPLATPELREICKTSMEAFACHMAFSDGAVAMIFTLTENEDEGFLGYNFDQEFGPAYDLMNVVVGGNFYPPTGTMKEGAGYRMNGRIVQKAFVELMLRSYSNLQALHQEVGLGKYNPSTIDSFVFHQASKPAILKILEKKPEIPRDRVPMIMEHLGNLAVASGPCALTGQLEKSARGSLHAMMLLGSSAGGAGYGSTFFRKNF